MTEWNGSYTWDTPPSATRAPCRLRIATSQLPVEHDIDRNVARIVDLVGQVAAAGADVVHFPECAVSGYGPPSWPDWASFD